MKPQLHWFFVCSIILLNTLQCDGIGFTFGFSAAAAAGAALYAGLNKLGCHFYECCDPRADWVKFNATGKGEPGEQVRLNGTSKGKPKELLWFNVRVQEVKLRRFFLLPKFYFNVLN